MVRGGEAKGTRRQGEEEQRGRGEGEDAPNCLVYLSSAGGVRSLERMTVARSLCGRYNLSSKYMGDGW